VKDLEHSSSPVETVRQGAKAAGAGACAGAVVGLFVGAMAGAVAGAAVWSFASLSKQAWRRYRGRHERD
jgi:hypothetical protein